MKSVFLIMYLYHIHWSGYASTGGPSLTIAPMPSIEICEEAGKIAKELADKQYSSIDPNVGDNKAIFRCIELGSKDTCIQKKN